MCQFGSNFLKLQLYRANRITWVGVQIEIREVGVVTFYMRRGPWAKATWLPPSPLPLIAQNLYAHPLYNALVGREDGKAQGAGGYNVVFAGEAAGYFKHKAG